MEVYRSNVAIANVIYTLYNQQYDPYMIEIT